MFAPILGGIAIAAFTSALAFGLMGDAHSAELMLGGAFLCSILAMVKR